MLVVVVSQVMGIMVCFFGLSAGICAQLYKGFFAPGPAGAALFLRFLAFALAGIAVITSPFINILPPHVDGGRHRFVWLCVLIACSCLAFLT